PKHEHSPTKPSDSVVYAKDAGFVKKIEYLENYVRDQEKNIGKLHEEIKSLKSSVAIWTRAQYEQTYNRAVEKVVGKLTEFLESGDINALRSSLNPLNSQAHVNPLGEQFVNTDGTIKSMAIAMPKPSDFVEIEHEHIHA